MSSRRRKFGEPRCSNVLCGGHCPSCVAFFFENIDEGGGDEESDENLLTEIQDAFLEHVFSGDEGNLAEWARECDLHVISRIRGI